MLAFSDKLSDGGRHHGHHVERHMDSAIPILRARIGAVGCESAEPMPRFLLGAVAAKTLLFGADISPIPDQSIEVTVRREKTARFSFRLIEVG